MTKTEPAWESPSIHPSLPADEVHVWRVDLDRPEAHVDDLLRILAAEERDRAARFLRREQKAHFVVARGVLRQLLGRCLDVAPEELRFAYGAHGKPELAGEHGRSDLRFNLSHSHQLTLYAVARGREVGIDVEHLRPRVNIERIARRFFAPAEVEDLQSLPSELRREGFSNCWTRKEAYLKARGKGITIGLDSFAVSLKPGEPAALLSCEDGPEEAGRWRLRSLRMQPGYEAALCVEGDGWRLRCWEWPD